VVIDDHELMLSTTSSVLQSAGFAVVGAVSTGADAVQAIESTQPDLAVLDFELPDMTGVELAARARELAPGTLLLLHSARIDPTVVDAALASGIRGIIVKGSATRLLDAVAGVREGEVWVDPTLATR
jgi:DNA-binding NarL/FixJ family response regulator